MLEDDPLRDDDAPTPGSAVPETDDILFCANCGAFVTRQRWAIERREAHEHVVFNPAGHLFRLRCFSQAPGAFAIGPPTDHFTWFAGYDWQIALCLGCDHHIGWRYLSRADYPGFWGLDSKMLKAAPPRSTQT